MRGLEVQNIIISSVKAINTKMQNVFNVLLAVSGSESRYSLNKKALSKNKKIDH